MTKTIIVEGKTDKSKLEKLINEPVNFICTFGTLSQTKLDELASLLEDEEVYVLVDADDSGEKLRKQFRNYLPNAKHLYTLKNYREVANTPAEYLIEILKEAKIDTRGGEY